MGRRVRFWFNPYGYWIAFEDKSELRFLSRHDERYDWLDEKVGRRNWTVHVEEAASDCWKSRYGFKSRDHALMFKLTWG